MGLLTVAANGQSLTVDLHRPGGARPSTFSDAGLSTPITLPLAITVDQDFYFPAGTNVVTVTVTTAAGVVLLSSVQHEVGDTDHVVVTPLPTAAQEAATDSAASGGSVVGAAVVKGPFSFAFDTPGLASGVTVWTPAVGDILLDVWVEIDTAFNGTTPLADLGTFSGATTGVYAEYGLGAFDLTMADHAPIGAGWLIGNGGAQGPVSLLNASTNGPRVAPSRFTATNPLKLCVSQTGAVGGTAIDSTAGAGRVYVVVATPDPF